jgi:Mn-containing catalase
VVRIVPVRVNSNLTARTLDQILGSKKQAHMSAFRYALQEIQRDLLRITGVQSHDQAQVNSHEVNNQTSVFSELYTKCQEVFSKHESTEAEDFAKDNKFVELVTEMLDVKTMANAKMRLWLRNTNEVI